MSRSQSFAIRSPQLFFSPRNPSSLVAARQSAQVGSVCSPLLGMTQRGHPLLRCLRNGRRDDSIRVVNWLRRLELLSVNEQQRVEPPSPAEIAQPVIHLEL